MSQTSPQLRQLADIVVTFRIGEQDFGVTLYENPTADDIGHYWVTLALLDIGWNFCFLRATAMVTECHSPQERTKAQGANNFIVFDTMASLRFHQALLTSSG